jgi:hypothetical protein
MYADVLIHIMADLWPCLFSCNAYSNEPGNLPNFRVQTFLLIIKVASSLLILGHLSKWQSW